MEAIFLVCGAGGPQLKRNPLGSMMTPENYQRILRFQIAQGLTFGVLGLALAIVTPAFVPWLVPAIGVLWAMGALSIATRLSTVGVPSRSLLALALAVGIASLIRLVYLAAHAA